MFSWHTFLFFLLFYFHCSHLLCNYKFLLLIQQIIWLFLAMPSIFTWTIKLCVSKITKSLLFIFIYFLKRFKLIFCSKKMKTIQTIKITIIFWSYSFEQCRKFFTARSSPFSFFSLGSWRDFSFCRSRYFLKYKPRKFPFLFHTTH